MVNYGPIWIYLKWNYGKEKLRSLIQWLIIVCCARCTLDVSMCNICIGFAQDSLQMRNICARLYLFLQCAIYAQDLHKIVLISPMHNICARLYFFLQWAIFAEDCTNFSNVQYMRKIFIRLYLFLHCARLYLTSNLKC